MWFIYSVMGRACLIWDDLQIFEGMLIALGGILLYI